MSSENGNTGNNGHHPSKQTAGLKGGNPAWVKGVSGNPSGRPRGSGFTETLRSILLQADPDGDPNTTHAGTIVRNIIAVAKQPTQLGMMAAKIIADRADPKELRIEIGQHVGFTSDEITAAQRMLWGPEAVSGANGAGHG